MSSSALGIVGGHLLAAADLAEGLEDLRPVQSEALEQLFERLGLADFEQAEEQVLDGNKFILERPGFFLGPREHRVDRLGDVHLRGVHASRDLGQTLKLPFDGELHRAWRDVQLVEQARHDAVFLAEERGKEMPRLHLVVRKAAGNGLRVSNRLTRHDGKFVEVHRLT